MACVCKAARRTTDWAIAPLLPVNYLANVVSPVATPSTRAIDTQAALHLFVHCAKGRLVPLCGANPLRFWANQRGLLCTQPRRGGHCPQSGRVSVMADQKGSR